MPKTKPPAQMGRPSVHGEPTVMVSFRCPVSIKKAAESIGPTFAMGIVTMAKQAKEYEQRGK